MKTTLFYLSFCFTSLIYPQTAGSIQIIDNSPGAAGTRHIYTADLNNDSFKDIIVCRGYNTDDIGIYWNKASGNFTADILDSVMDPVQANSGDFDGNGFLDIVVINESDGELWLYPNLNGNSFGNPLLIDTESTFGKNIEVADFDMDSDEDILAIWQHAINFYRNDGNANFSREEILTTTTSPNILECWDMKSADLDNDGDVDVVTAETIGGVVYENDGTGNFTPIILNGTMNTTLTAVALIDVDKDNLKDVLLHNNTSVELYQNQSQLGFSYHSDLFSAQTNTILSIMPIDANEDGFQDIYTAFLGDPRLFFNDGNYGFAQELILDNDATLFVAETETAQIVGDPSPEFIWAASGSPLAYQQLENLKTQDAKSLEINLYPNPVINQLKITCKELKEAEIKIYGILGDKLMQEKFQFPAVLNLSDFEKGIYFLVINSWQSEYIGKIIKQ